MSIPSSNSAPPLASSFRDILVLVPSPQVTSITNWGVRVRVRRTSSIEEAPPRVKAARSFALFRKLFRARETEREGDLFCSSLKSGRHDAYKHNIMSVTLHTNLGDLKVEIFCEDVPRTAENFLALCASEYYNNTSFHRNIKGFMIQVR